MSVIKKGIVLSGENLGWSIAVDDDQESASGGFYLYLTNNDGQGFDLWFESEKQLYAQLEDFDVDWASIE